MKKKWIWIAPLAILAMALFVFLGGELVLHLWNWLLPPLFGWRQINFWQALGLSGAVPHPLRRMERPWLSRSHMRRRIDERVRQRMDERWE